MRIAGIIVGLLTIVGSHAQVYRVGLIDPNLIEGVDATVRYSSGEFEVLAIDKAKYRVKTVVTIFNKAGNHNGQVGVGYDKLMSVNKISAVKYDKDGDRIFKSKTSDFSDVSATSGGTFFDDNRVKWLDLTQDEFPYTIEFEYEVTYNFLYATPDWVFHSGFDESVEYSKFVIKSEEDLMPRYRSVNTAEPVVSMEDGKKVLMWEVQNIKAIEYEPYGPRMRDIAPNVVTSPSKFEFEGYQGDLSSWDGMASWQNKLNLGRDQLPAGTVEKISAMVEGLSEEEKIKKVYEYVQSNTRYVSVQLGVGGFQPFPSNVVDEEGYGDCKALSFYTQTLLKEVGIKAHYTLVYAGANPPPLDEEFSGSYFNHVILCVPMEKDTVWLECTSQTNPYGYLGSFTGDRDVLLITDEGGEIVRTPKYPMEKNAQLSTANVKILDNGNAHVSLTNNYTGLKYEYQSLHGYLNLGKEKQKEWIENVIDIPSFKITDFEFINTKTKIPTATVTAELEVNKLSSTSGTRFFLQPNVMNRNTFIPNKDENRKQEIRTGNAYYEYDSITFELPEGHYVESMFDPIEINSEFGDYRAELRRLDGNSLLYIRAYKKYEGVFPNTSYEAYIDFNKKVVRADKRRVSFKKKT